MRPDPLLSHLLTSMIDQNATHHAGGDGIEVRAIVDIETSHLGQTQVGFVH